MARVLITDDASFMRMMLTKILQNAGHTVVGEAQNGREAVEMYQQLKPELTTMDITMPEMDGITAIKEIRKVDPKAKIIVCSAMGQEAMVVEAITAGCMDFVVKPFVEERVLGAIEKALG